MQKNRIYFRADGNATIGLGHVIRSLALAEMLCAEFECHFIIQKPLDTLKQQILEVCDRVNELPETDDFEEEAKFLVENAISKQDIIVLDGYNFTTKYQKILKKNVCKVVSIDDLHQDHFVSDIVINHAGGITPNHYSASRYTQFCLGPKYALLRKPFRKIDPVALQSLRNENDVFICFGGADPNNNTINALEKCEATKGIGTCYVVIGGANRYQKEIDNYRSSSSLNIQVLVNLSATQMVNYMMKCGIAITPPSTVAYEYLSIGGDLYLKTVANNQEHIYNFLIKKGLAFDLVDFRILDNEMIRATLDAQKTIFDGNQQKRFVRLFKSLTLTVRKANIDDMLTYFNWANDPEVRMQSFNPELISFTKHKSWFQQKIVADNCVMYIVSMRGKPIGQIRFDIEKNESHISYSLDKNFRGQGFGSQILRSGIAKFRKDYDQDSIIIGFVKKSNIASVKAFRVIGFAEETVQSIDDSFKYTLL